MAGQSHNAAGAKSGERIAKIMARAGLCSRREAEAWIAAGRVRAGLGVHVDGRAFTGPAGWDHFSR